MDADERQFLLTTAWLFARHGQSHRACVILQAAAEEDPRDGAVAAMLGELLLAEHRPEEALNTLRAGEYPPQLQRAAALLETRALRMLGRDEDANARWHRYVKASQGAKREWISE